MCRIFMREEKLFEKIIIRLTLITLLLILINNVAFSGLDYVCKKDFLLSNAVLVIAVIAAGVGARNCKRSNDSGEVFSIKLRWILAILFVVQIVISYEILFTTNTWDVARILNSAEALAMGDTSGVDSYYFSCYPNNQLLLMYFTYVFKLLAAFNVYDLEHRLLFLVIIQCGLSTATAGLVYKIVEDELKASGKSEVVSKRYALTSLGIYIFLIGLSGFNVVTYTDMMALIFPVAALRIYQIIGTCENLYTRFGLYVALGAICYLGYKMKPTVIIVLIAIMLMELVAFVRTVFYRVEDNRLKSVSVKAVGIISIIVGIGLAVAVFGLFRNNLNIQTDPEQNTGVLHMLMMGLNEENDGVCTMEDIGYSLSFDNRADRTEGQIRVIKDRLSNYGVIGFLRHTSRKALVVFNDGTFGYGDEAGFFDVRFNRGGKVASFLQLVYNPETGIFKLLSTILQLIWIMILLLAAYFCFFTIQRKESHSKIETIILLSILGIIIFDLLFEARARYVLLYVPFFIMASSIGLGCLLEWGNSK